MFLPGRSACYQQQGNHVKVVEDCTSVLEIDQHNIKGSFTLHFPHAICKSMFDFLSLKITEYSLLPRVLTYITAALLRRGLAFEALERYRFALEDIRKVLAIDATVLMANKAQHRIGKAVRALKKAKQQGM